MKKLILLIWVAIAATSCYTNRLLVGDVKPKEPMVEVSKEHNAHFIGGLAKTAKSIAEEHVGEAKNYAVMTRYGFGDMMLSLITAGIYTPTTTKYYIPTRYMDSFQMPKKEPKVRYHKDRGFLFSFEGEYFQSFNTPKTDYYDFCDYHAGLNLIFGYRSPHFIFGAGFGIGGIETEDKKTYNENDKEIVSIETNSGTLYQPFLRFRYLMLDKKSTPVFGVDLGYSYSELSYHDNYSGNYYTSYDCQAVFFMPHIGYQVRMGKNSYFDLHVGYKWGYDVDDLPEFSSPIFKGLNAKLGFSFVM